MNTEHDVVALILQDHRTMEELFRRMRSVEADRAAALREFAGLLIAHARAEETEVYPALRRFKNIDDAEVEHGEEEHDEGNEALLALLETDEVGSGEWDERLESLVEAVTHHLDEEERTILNGARENVGAERRAELGVAFAEERARQLAATAAASKTCANWSGEPRGRRRGGGRGPAGAPAGVRVAGGTSPASAWRTPRSAPGRGRARRPAVDCGSVES